MYGGCPYLSKCGFGGVTTGLLKGLTGKGKGMANEFLKKLRNKNNQNKVVDEKKDIIDQFITLKEEDLKTLPPDLKTLPPDAPSRITEKPKPKEKTRKKPSSRKKNDSKKGFVLYIDCAPVKLTSGGIEIVLFEDWFGPLVIKMNDHVKENSGLPSYRLLNFSEEKAMIDAAVNEAIPSLPELMVVSSSSPGAKDALGALIPHATDVIRAFR